MVCLVVHKHRRRFPEIQKLSCETSDLLRHKTPRHERSSLMWDRTGHKMITTSFHMQRAPMRLMAWTEHGGYRARLGEVRTVKSIPEGPPCCTARTSSDENRRLEAVFHPRKYPCSFNLTVRERSPRRICSTVVKRRASILFQEVLLHPNQSESHLTVIAQDRSFDDHDKDLMKCRNDQSTQPWGQDILHHFG